jgi:hypothetical protein
MLGPAILIFTNQDSNNEMGNKHAHSTSQEKLAAAEAIHTPKRPDTGNNLADIHDTRHSQLHLVV